MLKEKLKDWLGVSTLEAENVRLKQLIHNQEDKIALRIRELDKLTKIDVDVGMRGPCTVILSGVYRGKGYVQFYELEHDEFRYMVEEYRDRRKHGTLRNIDNIPYYRGGAFSM